MGASGSSQDTEALTEVLQKDQVVSQWLLQHVNSAYYGTRPSVALALGVAHLAGDLDEDHPWGGEEALTEELQGARVTRNLSEQESLSPEELTSMIAGITGEAAEFVKDILDTVA